MKFIVAIMAVALLAGCETITRKEVVVETRYVVRKASEAQKQLPPYPPAINPDTATQTDLAEWIAQNEKRMLDLESIIRRLIQFYEMLPTEEEKKAVGEEKK
jgi:outer membrane biogenesis lipoprotein LolB